MTDIKELRRLAEVATPGPWMNISSTNYDPEEKLCIQSENGEMFIYDEGGHTINDAKFIAAANPSAILSLLDKIDELVSALQMAKDVIEFDGTPRQFEKITKVLESVGVKP